MFDTDPFSDNPIYFGIPLAPDSVLLAILGLAELPRSRAELAAAFRSKVLETHPDRRPFDNSDDKAAVAKTEEFQQIVWARNTLLLRVHATPRTGDDFRNTGPVFWDACGEPIEPVPGFFGLVTVPHPHPDRQCKGCAGTRDTPGRHNQRDSQGRLRREWRDRLHERGRWRGYCRWCSHDLKLAELREARLRRRTNTMCNECGEPFTPGRAAAKYCSSACRQKAYRTRHTAKSTESTAFQIEGGMVREDAATKAGRYLVERRVIIQSVAEDQVRALARGDGAMYQVTGDGAVWLCTCPSRSLRCSHLLAVRRVVAVNLTGELIEGATR